LKQQDDGVQKSRNALIVLNEPVTKFRLVQLWRNCSIHFCADGGANRVFDALGEEDRANFLPDLIKGDFDSLRKDVKSYYEQKGVTIIEDDDQYATDLGKCVKALIEHEKLCGLDQYRIILLGGLTGRLDQTAHTIHALHTFRHDRKETWVVSDQSVACLIDKGRHSFEIDFDWLGPTCGLLPFGTDSAHITTAGLEWDLYNAETSFDTMVSSSNHLISNIIQIETSRPIVWTCELRPP